MRKKPPNAGKGRKKGSKNKPKPFEKGLIEAANELGPSAYRRIMKLALDAMENEIFVESADGLNTVKKVIYNFDPLRTILPYIASRKPEEKETPPPTPADSVKAAISVLKELEELSKPLDPKPTA